eukprot:CAMPEP_0202885206 /NCGR_PEP_ID=MMETSP1391-20130828/41545_1 /ASSEMBLY_ACC=CAM_ASM_000867 /TAXON_ID=1034604 /ORGANISM="Chlamydomonas leiostraca, Strain SAG 11-49" /LENGTH=185 /DNA_ID=CAMNT_0049568449 /DNA_START=285 /DNA_END=842 /DNA_ORIENTATION=+
MVLAPTGETFSHVATPTDACQVLTAFCGIQAPDNIVQATQLRLAGNAAAGEGRFEEAEQAYTSALQLLGEPTRPVSSTSTSSNGAAVKVRAGGAYLVLCNRAAVRLQLKRTHDALEDARAAVEQAPPSFVNGWVRLIDCHYAAGQPAEAAAVLARALTVCPQLKSTPEYRSIVHALKKAGCKVSA